MSSLRSPRLRHRPVRYVVAIGLALLGYYNVRYSLAAALARDNVELGHRLAPGNAQITARLAFTKAGEGATKSERNQADNLARKALRQDATAVVAVVTLGLNAELRGDRSRAARLFHYAQILSRRNLPSQLWAIENAITNDDIPGALKHYDIALRVTPASADVLFPVLAPASADPAIRTHLVQTLVGNPPWGEAFLNYTAEKNADPRAAASLLLAAGRAGATVPISARVSAINMLVRRGYADEAWKYYASERRGADRRRSRDPRFAADLEVPTQLDWIPVESPGMNAIIQRGDRGGFFEYYAPPSVGGAVLQQLQLLPPGVYRMSGHSKGIDGRDGERPYWLLTCHDGREFGRVDLARSTVNNGNFDARFTVPPGCGIQMLQLVARSGSSASGISGQIDRAQLEPFQ